MIFGLAVFDAAGIAGTVLCVIHHITVQATLFLVSGLITRRTGTAALDQMGGLARTSPVLAVLFAIPALTLTGIPPTSGFIAKLSLLQAGAGAGVSTAVVAGVVVATSLLTLYAMARVWVRVFWGSSQPPQPDPDPDDELVVGTALTPKPMIAAAASLAAVSMLIAVAAGPLSALSARAANDLLEREPYIAAVLGEGP